METQKHEALKKINLKFKVPACKRLAMSGRQSSKLQFKIKSYQNFELTTTTFNSKFLTFNFLFLDLHSEYGLLADLSTGYLPLEGRFLCITHPFATARRQKTENRNTDCRRQNTQNFLFYLLSVFRPLSSVIRPFDLHA